MLYCAIQHSYAGQILKDQKYVAKPITWSQHIQNKWTAIKKDNQEHYAAIGRAHAQAGQLKINNSQIPKK